MRANLFWFSDGQWARIEPFIPSNRRGVKPKNSRRILSGIMHVLKSGCRWVDCPPEYGPAKTVYNRFNRWSAQGIWQSIFEAAAEPAEPPERMALDSTHVKAHRCAGGGKGGASEQAIGITKGGRNSKIHGLVDKLCRPWVLILTPGNTADCTVAPACVSLLDGIAELLGDKAYDSNSFRKSLRKDGIKPVIPGRSNRKKRIRHDKQAYKDRNVIERCYCRLKDFRRIATRYDKLARNYFSALCLVAAVAFWLKSIESGPLEMEAAMKLFSFGLAVTLFVPAVATARHEQHAAGDKLGTVNFETSCQPPTRPDFSRAMALLHSFEFGPAIDSFNKVLGADPNCAIAYWGIALSNWTNPFAGIKAGPLLERGRAAAQKGLATGTPTPRERAYLAAVNQLYENAATISHRDRTLAYARAMEAVQREYRDDIEARIFYALALDQTALPSDKTYALQLQAAEILEPLWKKFPEHPGLAHYIIHTYDVPLLAPKALTAAHRYSVIAPSSPHALHMPSHTFTRVGAWQGSVDANRKSEQEALRLNVIGEALHAMDYQAYAHLQMAQDQKARALLDRIGGVAAKLPDAVQGAAPPVAGAYASAAVAARYALERGAWEEAAALQPVATAFANADAITHFARAIGAARSGRPGSAAPDVEKLAALRDVLKTAKDEYWAEQVDIERQIAVAWLAFADGKKEEAVRLMRAAADQEDGTDKAAFSPGPIAPARELLGEMLLDAGNAKDALAAFEATMKKEPNRFRGAYGAARAAEALGNRAVARKYYLQLIEIAKDADAQRAELRRARSFVGVR